MIARNKEVDESLTASYGIEDDNEAEIVKAGTIPEPNSKGLQSALNHRPIYIMAKWKERVTRDGRISLLLLIPSGFLDEQGISARLINENTVNLKFVKPSILLDYC